LRLNLAKHTSEDSEFRLFCKQAFVFRGCFDAVDCLYAVNASDECVCTHPQSDDDDASVYSDTDGESDSDDDDESD
jgi:hypothetical protein